MGVREPLTRLLALMEAYANDEASLPFLNDPDVRKCYTELSAIVDAHPPNSQSAPSTAQTGSSGDLRAQAEEVFGNEQQPSAGPTVRAHLDPTGTSWLIKVDDEPDNVGNCRSCNQEVLWVKRLRKKDNKIAPHPLDTDGRSHFATCPERDQWRQS